MIFDRILFNMDWQWSGTPDWLKRLVRKCNQWSWKFAHRYIRKHQYNIIRTDLPPGYHDIDELIEASLVKLLNRYVEDEMGGIEMLREYARSFKSDSDTAPSWEIEVKEAITSQQALAYKIIDLYQFFQYTAPQLRKDKNQAFKQWSIASGKNLRFDPVEGMDDLFQVSVPDSRRDLWDAAQKIEDELEARTTEALLEIVKIRGSLWT